MDLTEQTYIDEHFTEHTKDSIFTNGIQYKFQEHIGEWSFPFGVGGEEIESERFYPTVDWMYPLPRFWNKKNFIGNMRLLAEDIEPITFIYFPKDNETYLSTSEVTKSFVWDIARTYLSVGYLPPLWTCQLPLYDGINLDDPNNKIVALGCRKTLDYARSKVYFYINDLRYNILSHYPEIDDDARDAGTKS